MSRILFGTLKTDIGYYYYMSKQQHSLENENANDFQINLTKKLGQVNQMRYIFKSIGTP